MIPRDRLPRNLKCRHFDFVLVDGHSSLSLASALETLQNANLVAGSRLYSWRLLGVHSRDVRSSTTLIQRTDCLLTEAQTGSDIVVVSGDDAFNADLFPLAVWLARNVRSGVRLSALGTAAIILSRAGFLNGFEAAIHPWYRIGFAEAFPSTALSSRTRVSSGFRCSASGGISSIDLFLDFIEQDHGEELADLVADSMCYRQARLLQASVDISKPNSIGVLHPIVSKAIFRMEQSFEFPRSPSCIAAELNISTRQLERLFKKYTGQSPKKYNLHIRLQEAFRLLVQTRFEMTEIGLMTGFGSASHFTKCFRNEFQMTPSALRKSGRCNVLAQKKY